MIEALFNYYLEHQKELVKEYDGKYLIITSEGGVRTILLMRDMRWH